MPEQITKNDFLAKQTKIIIAELATRLATIAPVESAALLTFPGSRRAILVGLQECVDDLEGGGRDDRNDSR